MYTIKSKMASVFWVNYCYCCDCYYLYKRLILFDLVIHLHNNHPCRIYMYLYWHVPRLGWLINKFRLFQRTIFYCENKTKYTCTTNKQNVPTPKKNIRHHRHRWDNFRWIFNTKLYNNK